LKCKKLRNTNLITACLLSKKRYTAINRSIKEKTYQDIWIVDSNGIGAVGDKRGIVKMVLWKLKKCMRCGGDVFIDRDIDGWFM
jgi:hypothetical protein